MGSAGIVLTVYFIGGFKGGDGISRYCTHRLFLSEALEGVMGSAADFRWRGGRTGVGKASDWDPDESERRLSAAVLTALLDNISASETGLSG